MKLFVVILGLFVFGCSSALAPKASEGLGKEMSRFIQDLESVDLTDKVDLEEARVMLRAYNNCIPKSVMSVSEYPVLFNAN